MTLPFGGAAGDPGAEVFKYSLFLVLCNRLVTASIAATTLVAKNRREELRPVAPLWAYAAVSLSNVVATTCQYEALKYVSFAVQTLGKCAKMFPVMVWGYVISRKKYTARDVAIACSITLGCFIFFTTGETASRVAKSSKSGAGVGSTFWGVGLMIGYLAADGFTSTVQEKMFRGFSMTTYNQVLFTSLCSTALSSFGLLSSGQLPGALSFLTRHPDAFGNVLTLSFAASIGSLVISHTIKTFGALVFATIMTTRQFLSILLSSFVFGSPLSGGQWLGTCVVMGTLYYQGATGKAKAKEAAKAAAAGGGAGAGGGTVVAAAGAPLDGSAAAAQAAGAAAAAAVGEGAAASAGGNALDVEGQPLLKR
jgi:adenosine 3'-phospho 5'-phosphosulfate transporter B2